MAWVNSKKQICLVIEEDFLSITAAKLDENVEPPTPTAFVVVVFCIAVYFIEKKMFSLQLI